MKMRSIEVTMWEYWLRYRQGLGRDISKQSRYSQEIDGLYDTLSDYTMGGKRI